MQKRKKRTDGAPRRAYSVDTFCDAYEIGRSTYYGEIKSGRLKARKVNGRTIILDEDAEDWSRNLPLAGAEAA